MQAVSSIELERHAVEKQLTEVRVASVTLHGTVLALYTGFNEQKTILVTTVASSKRCAHLAHV